MLTLERLKEMLELQDQLEVRIGGADWRSAGHNYKLCIHMECAEILDQYGWKHWKDVDKKPDLDAIAMELVDVWHFAMAYLMLHENFSAEGMHAQLSEAIEEYDSNVERSIEELCIGMSFSMYATGKFPYGNFLGIMGMIGMSFDHLYTLYVSKNVLNWFRQDNGYKEGRYLKNWGGREDNEHLQEICDLLGSDMTAKRLYKELKRTYAVFIK